MLPQALRDRVHLDLGRLERHVRLEAREDIQVVGAASRQLVVIEGYRRPHLGSIRERVPLGQDSDDGPALSAQRDRTADDSRVRAEAPGPQAVPDQDDRLGALAIVLREEVAAEGRLDPEEA